MNAKNRARHQFLTVPHHSQVCTQETGVNTVNRGGHQLLPIQVCAVYTGNGDWFIWRGYLQYCHITVDSATTALQNGAGCISEQMH
jgi:hypothetical protein